MGQDFQVDEPAPASRELKRHGWPGACDVRRRRLRNILAVFGSRVQYSVFEAFLSRSLFDNLIKQIEVLIQSDADRVAVYPVCGTCAKKRLVFGLMDREWPADPIAHVF